MRGVLTLLALLLATSVHAGTQTQGRRTQDVVVTAAVPPANTDSIMVGGYATFASNASSDVFHAPSTGTVFTLQNLKVRAGPSNGVEVGLFYDPNGNLTGMTRLDTVFMPNVGGNYDTVQSFSFTGNGTRRIVLRTLNNSSQASVFRVVEGFEQ